MLCPSRARPIPEELLAWKGRSLHISKCRVDPDNATEADVGYLVMTH